MKSKHFVKELMSLAHNNHKILFSCVFGCIFASQVKQLKFYSNGK